MKKKNQQTTFSANLISISVVFAILSYALIQLFYKGEEWIVAGSPEFNPLQIIVDTLRLHWLSFLLWIVLIMISAAIIQRGLQKYSSNEKKLRYVLNSAVDGILLIDQNGMIKDTNPAAEKIFGYSELEMVGQNISMLMPEPYQSEHTSYIKNYLRTGKAKVIGIGRETVGKNKNGQIFPIDLAVSEVVLDSQRLFTGIVRDITSRKRLENKLEIQYYRQTALSEFDLAINQTHELQSMVNHVVRAVRDFLPADAGACILIWKNNEEIPHVCSINIGSIEKNEALKQILFGAKHYQEVVEKCKPLIVDEIKVGRSTLHKLLLENDVHSYAEIPLCTEKKVLGVLYAFHKQNRKLLKGDLDYLLALANRAAISIVKVNLYEDLRLTNRLLQNQKGELQAVLDSTGGAIALISPEMQFITLNQKFAETFGIDPDEIGSYQLQKFVSQAKNIFKDPEAVISRIYDTVNNAPQKFSDLFTQIWPIQRELGLFSRTVRAASGEYLGRLFVFRDVTHEREVDRMKSEFVSMVSHELRTPLTSIHGSLGLISGGVTGDLSEQTKTLIEIAYKNSERLIRLINDILDIEKAESGKMVFDNKVIDLIPIIKQAIQFNTAYSDQYGVRLQITDSIPEAWVFADSDRLMQVLTNLLSNAAKFSPSEGTVEISVTRRSHFFKIAITDHGSGIPKEFRKRIFQRFAQGDASTTRKKGGTGLGLSISKAIIEKLNGKIGYISKENMGTTFFFTLPEWIDKKEKSNL
jgi:PAS domain S-box-containing protein